MLWASQRREELRDAWENGAFSAAFETEMIVKNAGATGFCDAMKELTAIDAEVLYGESDE